MDRPNVGSYRKWMEYADWLEGERNQALDTNANFLMENSLLIMENDKLREAECHRLEAELDRIKPAAQDVVAYCREDVHTLALKAALENK
jgi:hypothetical protein